MKANDCFDLKRFGRYSAYDLRINGNKYLLVLTAFALVLYLWLLNQMRQSPSQFITYEQGIPGYYHSASGYVTAFVMGLIGLGACVGGAFTGWSGKIRRVSYLQVPASTLEKYLHPFLFRFIGGTLVFFLLFWVDAQLARLTDAQLPTSMGMFNHAGVVYRPQVFDYSMIFTNPKETPWAIIVFAFASVGAYLFAIPLYFRKMALVKTILSGFVGIFLVICAFVLCSHLFYPEQTHYFEVHLDDIQLTEKLSSTELAASVLACASWLFFLFIGFFKLKETKL